jgi:3-deoxy-D-manno-octulosonic-acid transferase
MAFTTQLFHQLYSVTFTLFLILSAPYFLLKALFQEGLRKEFSQRMGGYPDLSSTRPIWVHAASVGEVLCSNPLIKKIKKEAPHCKILLTTMTRTGHETAKQQVPEADGVFFFPWDHPLILRKALKRIQPRLLLIAETELWPNLLLQCGKKGVPIILFNGRISDRSFSRYHALRFFFQEVLKNVSLFLMQTEKDQSRIVQIGAPHEKTKVTGSIKFDHPFPPLADEFRTQMAQSLGLRENPPILIAGSTRPGEEEILIRVYRGLLEVFPSLILIVAPRHLNRLEEVERLLRQEGIHWAKRTSLPWGTNGSDTGPKPSPRIILLDTMGELMKLYGLGTLVFVGGSLVPLGGQNPLEPLFFKKCVLFGPHMFNFSEIARILTEAGGAVQVTGEKDLSAALKHLLQDESARNEVGERGYQLLMKHRGATEKIFEAIRPFVTPTGEEHSTVQGA